MKRATLLLILVACPALAHSPQPLAWPIDDFLPCEASTDGLEFVATDPADDSDCTVGGGTASPHDCICDGSAGVYKTNPGGGDITSHTSDPNAHHTPTVDTSAKTECADGLVLLGDGTTTCVDPATQSEFDTHTGDANAHHTPTVDTNAKTLCGDGETLLGNDTTTCDTPLSGDDVTAAIATHSSKVDAHHDQTVDTSAQTECADDLVLLGNDGTAQCVDVVRTAGDTMTGALDIDGAFSGGGLHINSSSGAGAYVDRGATANHYRVLFMTAGTEEWAIGNKGHGDEVLGWYANGSNSDKEMELTQTGDLTIDGALAVGDASTTRANIGAVDSNDIDTAINTHESASDPHSVYLLQVGESLSASMNITSTLNGSAFVFNGHNGLTGEQDVFTITDNDAGGGSQDESSALKVQKTAAFSTSDEGSTLVELEYTGATASDNRQFYILGRTTTEGALNWGIDITDSDIWTTGDVNAGATGTDCGGTGADCFNTPAATLGSDGTATLTDVLFLDVATNLPTCDASRDLGIMLDDTSTEGVCLCVCINGTGWKPVGGCKATDCR